MDSNKICIVLPCNIYFAPYYYRYEQTLVELGYAFDLVIWNRAGIDEPTKGNIISYNKKDDTNNGNKFKLIKFLDFARFVKKVLSQNKYDRVFILGTYAGTASLLSYYLQHKYYKRYWIDVRDYTYEWFKLYLWLLEKAIDNSYVTTVSSKGFEEFLPRHNYVYVHNVDKKTLNDAGRSSFLPKREDPIRISFIGNIRYYRENVRLLNALGNDNRFKLQYYGANSEKIKKYCDNNLIKNVDFHGRFSPNQTIGFYKKTDIINNIYGNDEIELTTAISNKLYYAACLKIPILVSKGTKMEEICRDFNFGCAFDYASVNLANNIYDWYKSIDSNNFVSGCDKFVERVIEDEYFYERALLKFILE